MRFVDWEGACVFVDTSTGFAGEEDTAIVISSKESLVPEGFVCAESASKSGTGKISPVGARK